MVMAAAMATESAMAMEMAMAMVMVMATARATITKEGFPLNVAAIYSTFGGGTPCLYPHVHKGKCIHQRCVMGVTLLRVFSPLHGGGVPDSSPWVVFFLFFTTTVQFTEQLSVRPPNYSGAQDPCQSIDPLPPSLLQEPHQPINNLPWLLLHFLSR
jgi:hypothetical protein